MNRYLVIVCASVSTFAMGCGVMGGEHGSKAHGEQESALEELNDSGDDQVLNRAVFSQVQETLQNEIASKPECDLMCTVKRWVGEERYAEAREVLETEVEESPLKIENVVALTSVNIMDEEYSKAYEWAQTYIDEGFSNIRLMENRAVASMLGHDVETAFEDFRVLIAKLQSMIQKSETSICDPLQNYCTSPERHEARAWVNLATVQYDRGQLDEAEKIAKNLLEDKDMRTRVSPTHGEFLLALIAGKRNKDHEAKERYARILERHPTAPGALNNMGGIYYRAHDLVKARAYFESAYVNGRMWRRGSAIAWSNVGEVDFIEGDYEAAEDKLKEAAGMSKAFAGADFSLGCLYDVMGKHELSKRHIALAMKNDQNGVTRWNSYHYTTEWEAHFNALIAEHDGNEQEAKALWTGLLNADEERLQASARRHLNLDELDNPITFEPMGWELGEHNILPSSDVGMQWNHLD
ncbi:MAG TPA: tetratricopeptide repeat protein [Myxococcales bacterium]|nr:tetratricopeptide repeat protein [Myxococcales bacterium]